MKGFKDTFTEIEEKAKEMSNKEYDKYFQQLLKKYKAKDIEDLSKEDKKKFFNDIEKNVKADSE